MQRFVTCSRTSGSGFEGISLAAAGKKIVKTPPTIIPVNNLKYEQDDATMESFTIQSQQNSA